VISLQYAPLRELFTENHIVFVWRQSPGNEDNATLALPENIRMEPFSMFISGGAIWSAGAFSYSQSTLPPETTMGRYCSLAPAISVLHSDHPLSFISTSPFSYRPESAPIFGQAIALSAHAEAYRPLPHDDNEHAPIHIGNDVWIGQNTLLKKGIHIHDGAVVAAGSVVTRDVEEFTIVGGVPAKPIKRRFPETILKKIKALQWWQYRFTDFYGLDCSDPERFLAGLERRIDQDGLTPFAPEPVTLSGMKAHLERKLGKA
jgi:acetyltransferase-like isoleucine patch superfamily enzyme